MCRVGSCLCRFVPMLPEASLSVSLIKRQYDLWPPGSNLKEKEGETQSSRSLSFCPLRKSKSEIFSQFESLNPKFFLIPNRRGNSSDFYRIFLHKQNKALIPSCSEVWHEHDLTLYPFESLLGIMFEALFWIDWFLWYFRSAYRTQWL